MRKLRVKEVNLPKVTSSAVMEPLGIPLKLLSWDVASLLKRTTLFRYPLTIVVSGAALFNTQYSKCSLRGKQSLISSAG